MFSRWRGVSRANAIKAGRCRSLCRRASSAYARVLTSFLPDYYLDEKARNGLDRAQKLGVAQVGERSGRLGGEGGRYLMRTPCVESEKGVLFRSRLLASLTLCRCLGVLAGVFVCLLAKLVFVRSARGLSAECDGS